MNIDEYDSVDDIWNSWKENIIQVANQFIGTRKSNTKLRSWRDKDIDKCFISDEIINDGKKIKNFILYYWRTLGKMNRELTNKNNSVSTHNIKEMVNHFRSISSSNPANSMNKDYLDRIDLTIDKVSSAISNSKNNKSPGIDRINNELLKNGGDCLTNSLFKLFSKILETNVTPKEWNTGVITPIHKKGDHYCK